MKTYVTILIIAAASAACDKSNDTSTTRTTAAGTNAPDNTRTNARDRANTMTPLDQGNDTADINTTQAIRKALMADDSLSNDAKNVKVITNNGVVTLRGPVRNESEKMNVERKANAAAGTNRVDDELDVGTK